MSHASPFTVAASAPVAVSVSDYIRAHWDLSAREGSHPTRDNIEPLPVRHTVPCIDGHFEAMFYWDTYFTNLGLLLHDRVDLARGNCEAMFHLVEQKGFMPNSTFKGDDTRSQPPYLCAMVRDVFARTRDLAWLRRAVAVLEREHAFWQSRRLTPCELNRHYHHATDDYLLNFYRDALVGRLRFSPDAPEADRLRVAAHYLGEAETGWDFNPRYSGRCGDFAQVELNCLLHGYETSLADFHLELGLPHASAWRQRAAARARLIHAHLWDEERGLFLDYDYTSSRRSAVASLGTFQPLFEGIATPAQAARVHANLPLFEREHGLAVCEERSRDRTFYQWGFPNGWPPLTYVAVQGLRRYGYEADARRIADKFCAWVERDFARTGQLWEKFDVLTGEIAGGEYAAQPMLGWTAGVYLAFRQGGSVLNH